MACRNFACYSMLNILSWRPKGGGHGPMAPPKYASGQKVSVASLRMVTLGVEFNGVTVHNVEVRVSNRFK